MCVQMLGLVSLKCMAAAIIAEESTVVVAIHLGFAMLVSLSLNLVPDGIYISTHFSATTCLPSIGTGEGGP